MRVYLPVWKKNNILILKAALHAILVNWEKKNPEFLFI